MSYIHSLQYDKSAVPWETTVIIIWYTLMNITARHLNFSFSKIERETMIALSCYVLSRYITSNLYFSTGEHIVSCTSSGDTILRRVPWYSVSANEVPFDKIIQRIRSCLSTHVRTVRQLSSFHLVTLTGILKGEWIIIKNMTLRYDLFSWNAINLVQKYFLSLHCW